MDHGGLNKNQVSVSWRFVLKLGVSLKWFILRPGVSWRSVQKPSRCVMEVFVDLRQMCHGDQCRNQVSV